LIISTKIWDGVKIKKVDLDMSYRGEVSNR